MADWDPFAIDQGPAESQAASGAAVASGKGSATASRISAADLDCIADVAWKYLLAKAPWQKSPDPRPDLSWHYPSCSFEAWTHKDVRVELGEGIAYIYFSQADEGNPLSDSTVAGLCDALFNLHYRKDLRVAIFSGDGKLFCCGTPAKGSDGSGGFTAAAVPPQVQKARQALAERAQAGGAFPDGRVNIARLLQAKLWHTLATLPQFTIALVNGSAIGTGVGCVAACDMAISVKGAFFSLPEVRDGNLSCLTAPYIVAKTGTGKGRRIFATGEAMSADRAKEANLLNEVVEDVAAGHKLISEICTVLTACGPRSVEAAKQLVLGIGGQPITEPLMFYTSAMLAMVTISDEARDGMVAVQARTPKPWEEKPIKPLH